MSSSLTHTVVDPFDEDEFPDVPKAPALLAALQRVPDPRKPRGLRHGLPVILSIESPRRVRRLHVDRNYATPSILKPL